MRSGAGQGEWRAPVLRIDGTQALPYKLPQLSDIPPETAAMQLGRCYCCESRWAWPRNNSGSLREESREADLSTEQAGAQAPSWLPDPDGNSGRSQGAQRSSRARPQAAQCVRPHVPTLPSPLRGLLEGEGRVGTHVGAMERLKRRKDFLAAAAGASVST